MSDNTRNFYGRSAGLVEERYMANVFGAFRAAVEEHLPLTVINDWNLSPADLAHYKVLILSNTASLSDAQVRAVHKWVQRGGRLLATFGSGYKSTDFDAGERDQLKLHKGHTGGLHQLWHDPLSTLFGTVPIDPGVDVRVTRYEGPTSCLDGELIDDVLPYGGEGNILIHRPEGHHNVFAFLIIPAFSASIIVAGFARRLLWGWGLGILGSLAGLALAYFGDLPVGATVVSVVGLLPVAAALAVRVRRAR